MKTLKIIVVLTLVALAATLLIASAYGYTDGRIGTSATINSPNTSTSYGSTNGGMMGGYGVSGAVGTAPQQSSTPSTTTSNIFKPMSNWMIGFCRGMMSRISKE